MRLGVKCCEKDSFYYNPAVLVESYQFLGSGRKAKRWGKLNAEM